jgi:hypothetical protein
LLPDPKIPRPPRTLLNQPNPLHPTLPHLSGFSYPELECSVFGQEIAWYNTQFYCGWGDAGTTQWYDAIVAAGWAPERVVLGVVTNPGNGLANVCARLRNKYEGVGNGFGGVMGWEYFNSGDSDVDLPHISSLEPRIETVQAGWVGALGRVLRVTDPPRLQTDRPALGVTPDQIRQMVTSLPRPSTSWPDEEVQKLVVLGFEQHEAVAALNATEGNVEMAAGFLFEHYPA